ncbi:MAG: beta-phosphoglucomutase [Defluviitaleaceae bacterium]|nr:beta-phosphoglucomutase [Defluviitaleaceae bacterium]
MKYKAIIFDLDGVICHTDKYHYLAWKQVADRLGIYFDEEINNRLRGVSRMESLEIVLERCEKILSHEEKLSIADEKNEIYKNLLKDMSPADVSKEVMDTLTSLKNSGILLGIGSSSKNAKLILSKIGLQEFFDAISDGIGLAHSKPNPEVFVKCAQMLNIDPTDCLVIEDAIVGVQAAKAAKMDSVAVGDAAKQDIATYKMECFTELIALV